MSADEIALNPATCQLSMTDPCDYQKTPVGFSATATLPLAWLGWTPQPGTAVRMDLGYLFGNSTGNQCAQRAYWSNNSPTSGIIGDVPSESRLEPKEWGTATVE